MIDEGMWRVLVRRLMVCVPGIEEEISDLIYDSEPAITFESLEQYNAEDDGEHNSFENAIAANDEPIIKYADTSLRVLPSTDEAVTLLSPTELQPNGVYTTNKVATAHYYKHEVLTTTSIVTAKVSLPALHMHTQQDPPQATWGARLVSPP
ncbi:hypothetical protein PQX77_011188 [Marasmius sp. AFHP31]|nr:hypothetical protein PQX77_011188 [Marasmius sp. AFHP31]